MRDPIQPIGTNHHTHRKLIHEFLALLIQSLSLFKRPENQLKHLLMVHAAVQRPHPQTTTLRLRPLQLQQQRPDAFYRLYTAWDPERADSFLLKHLLPSLPPDAPLVLATGLSEEVHFVGKISPSDG